MNRPLSSTIGYSACPHDCPSTCALEVEVIDGVTVGRVHGAKANDYTAGVICAKVARYAERIHNPNRCSIRFAAKAKRACGLARRPGSGSAGTMRSTSSPRPSSRPRPSMGRRRSGRITTPARWGWCSGTASIASGTPVATRASSTRSAPTPAYAGIWRRRRQARRARPARDGEVGPRRDLGDQRGRDPGQRHDPCGQGAEGARRADRGHRRLPQRDDEAGRHRDSASSRAPTRRSPAP